MRIVHRSDGRIEMLLLGVVLFIGLCYWINLALKIAVNLQQL